ncbi:MAG: cephalosporin hydroxylase [Planctomycetes bacterium]|nr:cephalosporin hydroxylase [Planctomycetota bacterium]
MSDIDAFQRECAANIAAQGRDAELSRLSREWIARSATYKYVYNWRWCGLPIIQLPPDVLVTQEIIWEVRPTLVVETGVARGGSLVFSASLLAMLDAAEATRRTPATTPRRVIGIDIDIRPHNRAAIEAHPFAAMIRLLEGSSIDPRIVADVRSAVRSDDRVLVVLDSNHTHDHVLAELEAYAGLVTPGSYCIVQDTGIDKAADGAFPDRPWGRGNSPLSAVAAWLPRHPEFTVDWSIDHKLQISSSPGGYLRRTA